MILGIDIGGSHITAALVKEDPIEISEGSEVRYRVNSHGTADEILDAWSTAIKEIWTAHHVNASKIGVAMPGPFDYRKGIALMIGNDKYEALYEMNVREALASKLGIAPDWIRFRNDAEAFLLGEVMGGAGIGYTKAIGITLGTGLGSAVYNENGTIDAERYKYPLYDGIAEEYISTRFFVKRYQQLTGVTVKDARELATLITTDTVAAGVYNEFGTNLGLFLKDFIRDEQPQIVVIGGNIAQAWDLFYPVLASLLEEELKTVVIKKAALGEGAALVGGACSWLQPATLT